MFLCPLNCKARSFYIEIKSILSTAGLRTSLFIGLSCDNTVLCCSQCPFLGAANGHLESRITHGCKSEVNYIRALPLNKNWQIYIYIYKTMLSRICALKNVMWFLIFLKQKQVIQPFWRKVLWCISIKDIKGAWKEERQDLKFFQF